jgi:hypothetical protein
MAKKYTDPSMFIKKNTPDDQLQAIISGTYEVATPIVKNIASNTSNALKQAWKGFSDWASPPPLSPIPEKTANSTFAPGGIKQAVNNIVAVATMRPELIRKFPSSLQEIRAQQFPTPTRAPVVTPMAMQTPYPSITPEMKPSINLIQQLFGKNPIPTPTPTVISVPSSSPSPTQGVTPYPTPRLNESQEEWGNELIQAAKNVGVKVPEIAKAIGFNEASLIPERSSNVTEKEDTHGPAGINILPNAQGPLMIAELKKRGIPETRDNMIALAQDREFAKQFMVNRMSAAQQKFPDSIERQILYYNVPRNAYIEPQEIPYQAAWYLMNAMKTLEKIPSEEYLPVLQKYGFF